MARLKRSFSNHSQVVHLWANQSQNDARCKNVYFTGKSIWSYGSHYELGRMVTINGVNVALVNDTGYSVTTSKHISSAWQGVSHLPRIRVGHDFNYELGLLKTQDKLIRDLMSNLSARSFYSTLGPKSWGLEGIKDFNRTCLAIGKVDLVIDIPKDFLGLINSHIKKCIRKTKKQRLEKDVIREQNRLESIAKGKHEIVAWSAGQGIATTAVKNLEPQIIRIKDDRVETSRGAEVPLKHAVMLLERILKGQANQGDKIGSFVLDKVLKHTVVIGCHTINIDQAKEVLSSAKPVLTLVK